MAVWNYMYIVGTSKHFPCPYKCDKSLPLLEIIKSVQHKTTPYNTIINYNFEIEFRYVVNGMLFSSIRSL